MRWFYIAIIVVLGLITLILAFQNFHTVTLSFLGLALTLPLVILIIIIYVLGMITGGSLLSLIRWAAAGASYEPPRR